MGKGLIRALQAIVGSDHVVHERGPLHAFEYDATIERALPDVVVFPGDVLEVAACVRAAREHGVPITPRGAGTGLAGGSVAVKGGVLIVLTRFNRIREIDPENRIAVVESGVTNQALQDAVQPFGLMFAPDPSSQRVCTIGGNVATNAGGAHTLARGSTANHVLALEVVLPDGRIQHFGSRVPDAPGLDIRALLVGSEGTLGIVTKVTVQLARRPQATRTLLATFEDVHSASVAVSETIRRGVIPAAMEMLDQETVRIVEACIPAGYPEDAGAVLLVEVEGDEESADEQAAVVTEASRAAGARDLWFASTDEERERLWKGRKAAVGAVGRVSPAFYLVDGVVPRTRLPEVMDRVADLSRAFGLRCANVFHAGDGNLHPSIMFDPAVEGEAHRVLELAEAIVRVCVEEGGSITGEHGVGLEKRSYMNWVFSTADLAAQHKVREAFGAPDFFNPCKVLPTGHGCASGHGSNLPLPSGTYA